MFIWLIREQNAKGGRGSGNWGHIGRKGLRGGSAGLKDTPIDRLQLGGERYVAAKEPRNGRSTIARRTEKVSRRIDENTLTPAESGIVYGANQRGGSQSRLQAIENIINARARLASIAERSSPQAVIDRQEVITTIQENAKIVADNTPKSSKKALDVIKVPPKSYYDDTVDGDDSGRTEQEVYDIMVKTIEKVELPEELANLVESGKADVTVKVTSNGYRLSITDSNDDDISYLTLSRKFTSPDVMYNSLFTIAPQFRGSNVATQIYASQEKALMEAGVKKVRIQANIDVGGYAWARMGFGFDEGKNAYDIENVIDREWNQNTVSYEWGKIQRLTGNADFARQIKSQLRGKQPYEIATMNFEYEGKKVSGKDLLLGTNWYAEKNLNPNDVGYQLGRAYYESKGVTP